MLKYAVQVDISAKVEQWDRGSAVAASNGHSRVLWVPSSVKRQARDLFRGNDPIQFVLMAAFSYLALQPDLANISRITLDQDYSGNVAKRIIVRRLVEHIRCDFPKFPSAHIKIARVAESRADKLARLVFVGERLPDREVTWKEIENVLGK